jgi:tripartite-type tricarboxylate transporter receptor subunit TctC
MSPELAQRIHQEVAKVMQTPEMVQRFKSMGLEPGRGSPADFAAMVASDSARWGRLVKERNIKVE